LSGEVGKTMHDVHWHLAAYDELLGLNLPPEASLTDVVAEVERWADSLSFWSERDPDKVGDLEYHWIFAEAKVFSVMLPDGEKWGFRDLRLFCLDCDPVQRICIVALDANGAERIAEDFFGLLARVDDAHRLHPDEGPT
jgi:hypothetical protein